MLQRWSTSSALDLCVLARLTRQYTVSLYMLIVWSTINFGLHDGRWWSSFSINNNVNNHDLMVVIVYWNLKFWIWQVKQTPKVLTLSYTHGWSILATLWKNKPAYTTGALCSKIVSKWWEIGAITFNLSLYPKCIW